ncbi:MAG: metallophosphoesterase, partial [Peptostreptococcus porci]|nr:metallophosphoesterase [Peptostreptococcus porci]
NKRIVSRDNHSLSYLYKLSSNVNLLLLDTNSGKNINEVSNGTLKWIERILKYTSSRNEIVISVSHQNILIHNKMFASGYRIKNASSIVELYKKYNVRLNLSGHMHLQHISQYNGVYDISIGSIGLYPHIYAVVDIDDVNTIEYFTEKLSISKWMEKYGYKDDTLVNFENFSREKFRENVLMQSSKVFSGEKTIGKFKKEDIEKMMEFMVDSSVSYFSGEIYKNPQLRKDNPTLKMWLEHFSDEFQVKYLESIYTDDVLRNHNEITIKQ